MADTRNKYGMPSSSLVSDGANYAGHFLEAAQAFEGYRVTYVWVGPTMNLPQLAARFPTVDDYIRKGDFRALAMSVTDESLTYRYANSAAKLGLLGTGLAIGEGIYDVVTYDGPSKYTRAGGVLADDAAGLAATGVATWAITAGYTAAVGTPLGVVVLGFALGAGLAYTYASKKLENDYGFNLRNYVTSGLDNALARINSWNVSPLTPSTDLNPYQKWDSDYGWVSSGYTGANTGFDTPSETRLTRGQNWTAGGADPANPYYKGGETSGYTGKNTGYDSPVETRNTRNTQSWSATGKDLANPYTKGGSSSGYTGVGKGYDTPKETNAKSRTSTSNFTNPSSYGYSKPAPTSTGNPKYSHSSGILAGSRTGGGSSGSGSSGSGKSGSSSIGSSYNSSGTKSAIDHSSPKNSSSFSGSSSGKSGSGKSTSSGKTSTSSGKSSNGSYHSDGLSSKTSSGSMFAPVVLDLNDDGFSLSEKDSGNTYFDMAGDGKQHLTAWAGAGDGVLVCDVDNDGIIDRQNEVVFTEWDPTAQTDMQAIRAVFDSNHNGKLDAGDANFSKFKVLVTKDDGTKELKTLTELGITSINLISNNQTIVQADGSKISGSTTFTRTDGTTGKAGDAEFAFDDDGYLVQTVVTTNPDGSTQIATKSLNTDGSVESERKLTTSADGFTRSLWLDLDGDGVGDRIQSDVTVVNADSSTTRTVSNFDGGGILKDRTITVTSADRKTVTISRDLSGGGITEQEEIRTTGTDGSLTVTVREVNTNGSTNERTVTVTGSDGLSKSEQHDLTGTGTINSTTVTSIVVGGDGSRDETVTNYSGAATSSESKVDSTETVTSADGRSKSVSIDEDGDGVVDTIWSRQIVVAADSSSVTTEVETNHDGSLRSKIITDLSGDALSRTEKQDEDGDGDFDTITSDVTTLGALGARTQTVRITNGDLSLRSQTTTSWSADGRTRTITTDSNGDAGADVVETISVNSSGVTTDTVSAYSPNGLTLIGKTTSTISADGLSRLNVEDFNGDGVAEARTQSTVSKNADGSSTSTNTSYNGAGTVVTQKTTVDVSANGLTTTTRKFFGSDNVADSTVIDATLLNGDGSTTRTITSLVGITEILRTVVVTSADRNTETSSTYLNGSASASQITTNVINADGSRSQSLATFTPDGSRLVSRADTMVSADGLITTGTVDRDGDGLIDIRNVDAISLNVDGTKTEVETGYRGSGISADNQISQVVTTTSANGQNVVTTTDRDGDGDLDRQMVDQTTIGPDGATTRTVAQFNGVGNVLIDRTTRTTSGNGLSTITQTDLDGDGIVDVTVNDQTLLQSNGTVVHTVAMLGASGALKAKTVTTTLPDGRSGSVQTDLNGDGGFDIVDSVSIAANGDRVETVSQYGPDGTQLVSRTVTTVAANGLETRVAKDLDGDGDFDEMTKTTTIINADGSKTVTTAKYNGDGTIRIAKSVVTTSADGLTSTRTDFIDGDENPEYTTVTGHVINADGTSRDVTDIFGGANGNKLRHTSTDSSADGRSWDQTNFEVFPLYPAIDSSHVITADGSEVTTQRLDDDSSAIFEYETKITTISADKLTKTVLNDYTDDDDSFFMETISSVTKLNSDGSMVVTEKDVVQTTVGVDTLIDQSVKTISADGLVSQQVWTGALVGAATSQTVLNNDGTKNTTTVFGTGLSNNAVTGAIDSVTTTETANGLDESVTVTLGTKVVRTDISSKHTDGSTVDATSLFNSTSGALAYKETVTGSADGLTDTLERDSDGIAGTDHREVISVAADGTKTTVVANYNNDGTLKDKVTTTVSANGFSITQAFDFNGDGVNDRSSSEITVLNADGSRTETVSQFDGDSSALLSRTITNTSADGLLETIYTQLSGSGVTDEIQVNSISVDTNGEKLERSNTYYSDGTKRSGYVQTTRIKGRVVTEFDHDGDGAVDEYQGSFIDKLGNARDYYESPLGKSWRTGAADDSANTIYIDVTDDGNSIYIDRYKPVDPANPTASPAYVGSESIDKSFINEGSYRWRSYDATDTLVSSSIHSVDVNDVDTITWTGIRGTSGTTRIEVSHENIMFERMQRVYDVVFDRDMQNDEKEQLASYIVNGDLNVKQLATDLMARSTFSSYYGTLSNVAFIGVLYQNAYDRAPSIAETQTWLGKLNAGTITKPDLVLAIAESAEHQVLGNEHITTNVTAGGVLHSTDKAVAGCTVDRLYEVMLNRNPSDAERAPRVLSIVGGTKTQFQVASEVLASTTFTALYGSPANGDFVALMFQNALGRAPTASEAQFWTAALGAGTTRADLVVALSTNQGYLVTNPSAGLTTLGTTGVDTMIGSYGNDTLDGAGGDDRLFGSAGNDLLIGSAGNDLLAGGLGDDTFDVDVATDMVVENAGDGTDTIRTALASFTLGQNVENLTYAGSGAFVGSGNAAANVIGGGIGNDTLDGKLGADTLIGGAGNDVYVVDTQGDVLVELANGGTDVVQTALNTYSMAAAANVENLTFTGTGGFTAVGNGSNNVITGGSGADNLSGDAGDDTLIGGSGADTLSGGAGNDVFVVDNAGDMVIEAAAEGNDTVQTNLATYTLGSDVENLTYTGTAAFTGNGNSLNNVLTGGAGVDTLKGFAGDDTYVISTGDIVVENAGEGIDTVQTNLATYTLGSNIENLTYTGTAAFTGTGTSADNILKGSTAADKLTGGAGNDTLDGGVGADTLIGGLGDDLYFVDNASEVVTEAAGEGTDTVKTALAALTLAANVENLTYIGSANFAGTGNALANTITGGNGNDTLNGGSGSDTLIGGLGDDIYVVDVSSDIVIEAAGEGVDTVQTNLTSFTLGANLENLTSTGTIAFSGVGNALNNVLTGGSAVDTLSGGSGDDTLDGKAGADTMVGGLGDDTYIVDNAADVTTEAGDEGTDTVKTALTTYTLAANIENLTSTGTAAFTGNGNALANTLRGGIGADTLDGKAGADTLIGGAGNDIYIVDSLSDTIVESAGEGTDTVKTALSAYSLAGSANVESLTFIGTGDFVGSGNDLANTINGSTGNDILDGGLGIDILVGGTGNDVYIVDNASEVITEGASAGTDEIRTALATYSMATITNVENLSYIGSANFTGSGNSLANRIVGGAGNDVLDGGAGIDTLLGGTGNDTYVVDVVSDVVTELTNEGIDTIKTVLASFSIAAIANLENLTYTGSASFTGTGNALDNVITGGAVADNLSGGGGNDTLIGGGGVDTMAGGLGDDTYVVDVATDVVNEAVGEGTDTVQTALATYTLGTNVENLTYTGTANFTGNGNASANVITGGIGNDILDGRAGADTLVGGSGNDTYIVDNVADVLVEAAGSGTDTAQTALAVYSLASSANVENLTFTGTGNFAGTGNSSNNVITGGSGSDTLSGGAGDDTLIGGIGADSLSGGLGDDLYIVENGGDVVIEYSGEGVDTVQTNLAAYTLSANVENLVNTGSAAFTGNGNALNNTMTGGSGVDTFSGGAGDDTYVIGTGDVVIESASEGVDTVRTNMATYTLTANVENLVSTGTAAFTGTGNELDNVIKGGAAVDKLTGGAGNDTLDGGVGADTLIGGSGNDLYIVDNAGEIITELTGEGNDTVKTAISSFTLAANVENLTYTGTGMFTGIGNALANTITGGVDDDWLNGGVGADLLIGYTGDDVYVVDNGNDVIVEKAGEGVDAVRTTLTYYTLGAYLENVYFVGSGNFTGIGNGLNNWMEGDAGTDQLYGGDGDDTLDGYGGADLLVGGKGNDIYYVDDLGDVVTEEADEGADTISTSLAIYSIAGIANIETLSYYGTVAFTGTGNALNNIILGADDAANVLDGGLGADTMWGGSKNDVYIVDDINDNVMEEAAYGTDLIKTTLNTYSLERFTNVENLTFIGSGNFVGKGNGLANTVTGSSGDDVLDGATGADTLIGGLGNDVYMVDNTGDVVTEAVGAGIDEIRTTLTTYAIATLTNVENLAYSGSSSFNGTGNAGSNTITGGVGNDVLNGGAGTDVLIGGLGNDTYIVDVAGDIVTEGSSEGVDTVQTALTNYSLGSNVENLVFTGTGAFAGTGNNLDNLIVGGAGANTLNGGTGNDILIGGAAADIFVYAANSGHDSIVNFVAAGTTHDFIRVDHTIFADWASVLAASSQSGNDTVITADSNNTITLKNVAVSSLQAADFQFA
ncbi:DUF4214 domain-containing protein [Rhizobium sp. Rhizsp82]|uniref:DUF4214 domain-containing protein n=1 Tax=Rhizobium sp. Rhizsp82 TaxID=3243057 RepID=UPI0039B4E00B